MIVDRRFRGAYCLHHQGWSSLVMMMSYTSTPLPPSASMALLACFVLGNKILTNSFCHFMIAKERNSSYKHCDYGLYQYALWTLCRNVSVLPNGDWLYADAVSRCGTPVQNLPRGVLHAVGQSLATVTRPRTATCEVSLTRRLLQRGISGKANNMSELKMKEIRHNSGPYIWCDVVECYMTKPRPLKMGY
jgi:hypothetical protein